jgi:predicted secreted protein
VVADFQLTAADNGKSYTVRAGDRVIVRLPEGAAGGGHLWQVERLDEDIVALESRRVEPPPQPPAAPPRVGADRTAILTFTARSPGHTAIELMEARPWDPASVANRFRVEIDVTG